jgi:GNAT superfamily N-acetyltransferase
MNELQIRPMTTADVDAVSVLYGSGGWDARRSFLIRFLANPACQALVGVRDGQVVATGMATINGPVGWVGSIFVDARLRRHGLGRAMTDEVCARLDAADCTSQVLIASEYGRPMYETMGFQIDGWYQILESFPIRDAPTPARGKTLRRMRPDDMARVGPLDMRATGEDRSRLLSPLADTGWLLEAGDELLGYLISVLPESAALVAPDAEDALLLLDLLRHLGNGRDKTVRAMALQGRQPGQEFLERHGWQPTFATPRMIRGRPIDWQPALIWSLLGFAFG